MGKFSHPFVKGVDDDLVGNVYGVEFWFSLTDHAEVRQRERAFLDLRDLLDVFKEACRGEDGPLDEGRGVNIGVATTHRSVNIGCVGSWWTHPGKEEEVFVVHTLIIGVDRGIDFKDTDKVFYIDA